MPAKAKSTRSQLPLGAQVEVALASLRRRSKKTIRDTMGPRYGIHTTKAFGVAVGDIRAIAKEFGTNHELAAALWTTGWYEARMLAAFVDDPDLVTPAQMDRWCKDFDNWGICDTLCFHLFDKTPHAWDKVAKWARSRDEFVKRGSFALIASLALHDKASNKTDFLKCLPLIEKAASDERNFVKKGVSWALRGVGSRNIELNAAAITVARRLADSANATERWVGKDALRDITRPAVIKRLATRGRTRH